MAVGALVGGGAALLALLWPLLSGYIEEITPKGQMRKAAEERARREEKSARRLAATMVERERVRDVRQSALEQNLPPADVMNAILGMMAMETMRSQAAAGIPTAGGLPGMGGMGPGMMGAGMGAMPQQPMPSGLLPLMGA